jgi:hypothetical protein
MQVVRNYLNKGSFTIEAILVTSFLLITLFLFCFAFQLCYQQVLLTETAAWLAQVVAQNEGKPQPFYYQGSLSELGKENALMKELSLRLSKSSLRPKEVIVEIEPRANFLQSEIVVNITQEIKVPLGHLQQFFSGKTTWPLVGKQTAVCVRPTDFINHLDLFVEWLSKGEMISAVLFKD